jgi:hypothetical protein
LPPIDEMEAMEIDLPKENPNDIVEDHHACCHEET